MIRAQRSIPLTPPPTIDVLLEEFSQNPHPQNGRIVSVENIEDKQAYNPCLIKDQDKEYLSVRIESPNSYWLDPVSYDPKVMFFAQSTNSFVPIAGAPIFDLLEDPFSTWVHDEKGEKILIFGGVRVDRTTSPPTITTQFFKGKSVKELESTPFAIIKGMKDIRIIERADQKTKVIFTRPVGGEAGLGSIGVTSITQLSELHQQTIDSAQILKNQIHPDNKLGPNELYIIKDGDKEYVGVLGHISHNIGEVRHYYAMTFLIDPDNPLQTQPQLLVPKIIATRADFSHEVGGKTLTQKTDLDLDDVLFPGSLVLQSEEKYLLYTGVGDAHVGVVDIINPWG